MVLDQPPANATTEASKSSDVAAESQAGGGHELQVNETPQEAFDIVKSINNMYRILDLFTERGSGGPGCVLEACWLQGRLC
ncbi:hypothetical protein QCA50_020159 [Cerrena zonata]|uniref:Uncharacterized protein n=1 Tax=Cerrena zonata TaxID=2478898 RepID=A0AAW0F9I9_9APHY